jgi:hypothetical protein
MGRKYPQIAHTSCPQGISQIFLRNLHNPLITVPLLLQTPAHMVQRAYRSPA